MLVAGGLCALLRHATTSSTGLASTATSSIVTESSRSGRRSAKATILQRRRKFLKYA